MYLNKSQQCSDYQSYQKSPLLMRPNVLGQMIAAHKLLCAQRALKPLLAGMCPSMALQLVRPRKPFTAMHPVADERPFAGMPSQVRLQMGRLAVHLVTARMVAIVLLFSVRMPFALRTVRTGAGDAS